MRKAIARRLAQSIGPVPHFFLTTEIDMERARAAEERARKRIEEASTVDVNLAQAEVALQKALLRQMLAGKGSGTGTIRP